jgi:hypothetical protein
MVSDKVFTTDGTTNIFTSDFPVISEDHIRVFLGGTVVSRDDYDLINNSAVFFIAPTAGQTLTLQIGTTPADILTSPTDAGIVAANIADIQTLADIAGDISTVENISGDVETVADISTNVTTVATNISSVNTVASNINEVITVANDLTEAISEVETVALDLQEATSEIETVAGSIDNVDIVGTNITDVNTVATNIADVNSVAAIDGDVSTVAGDSADVQLLATITADIQTLADIEDGTDATDAIQKVAAIDTDVTTVAGIEADVTTVAGIEADVTAVANISQDIQDVQDKLTEVQVVADDLQESVSEIETVAADIDNVNTVAGINSEVTTVAIDSVSVQTVANDIANVNTVAGINADVTTVAGIDDDVSTVAANITDIQNAEENATLAGEYATKAENSYVTGTTDYSAYHWAQKSAQSAATSGADYRETIGEVTYDLQGFPNRTDSTIAFDEGTLEFTLAPASTSFAVYYRGELFTISSALTLTITDTTGGRYIKFDPTTSQLAETTINGHPSILEDLLVAYIFWDSSTQKAVIFGEERHGSHRDTQWHLSQHLDVGAVWRSGGGLGFTLNDNDATVSVGTPLVIADEDLTHTINHGTATNAYEQVLSGDAEIPAIYLSGTDVIQTTPTTVPWVQGTSTVRYNPITGGSGSLVDTHNNSYVSYWIIATNDTKYPIKAMMGHYSHNNIAGAELEEFDDYGFSVPELVPMYQVILKASNSAPSQCQIAAVYTLTSRQATAVGGFSASSHDNLTDRGISDQHPIGAITNLQATLDDKASTAEALALSIALG